MSAFLRELDETSLAARCSLPSRGVTLATEEVDPLKQESVVFATDRDDVTTTTTTTNLCGAATQARNDTRHEVASTKLAAD